MANRTKASVKLEARVSLDLAVQGEVYAAQHHCSISDLIREGLAWRITQETPGRDGSSV